MKIKQIVKISLIVALTIMIVVLGGALIFVSACISDVKNISINLDSSEINSSEFYDINGDIINNESEFKYISINKIPQHTIDAFISIEDKDFYRHNGLNIKRIIGALLNNIKSKNYSQGASTITQQLIKNKYLSNEKSISRKVKEAYLSIKLENIASKDLILESYLNTIYYGHGLYGIGNASMMYFDKDVSDLTLSESCILAGLIKSPNTYSPINNLHKSINRRNVVLSELLEDKKITEAQYNQAKEENVNIKKVDEENRYSDNLYTQFALDEASQILKLKKQDILTRGYKIYTYQDCFVQTSLDNTISNEINYKKNPYGNIADSLSIIVDNKSGGVKAVSGRSKYDLVNFRRQPGSLIKPTVVFAPALEEGLLYPCSQILDEKISINNYSPHNVNDKYYGYVSVREALGKSLNIPAIKVMNELGIDKCKSYGEKCGFEFEEDDNGLAIALGGLTKGCTLKELVDSYSPLVNKGNFRKSIFIKCIRNSKNIIVYDSNLTETKYCSEDTAYLMTNTLQYGISKGTSKKLSNLPFDIAGKTGTVNVKNSNLNTDAYSIAYTSNDTMIVWLGNYSMEKEYNLEGNNNGGTYATQMINQMFSKMYANQSPQDFQVPSTIVTLPIDNVALEKSHMIYLADNITDRYKTNEIFSSKHIPPKRNIEDILTISNFKINTDNNNVEISFDTTQYATYEIYRIQKDEPMMIDRVTNYSGNYIFVDSNIEYNNKYKYFIISRFDNSSNISEKIDINIQKNFEDILDNNNDFSFLFS